MYICIYVYLPLCTGPVGEDLLRLYGHATQGHAAGHAAARAARAAVPDVRHAISHLLTPSHAFSRLLTPSRRYALRSAVCNLAHPRKGTVGEDAFLLGPHMVDDQTPHTVHSPRRAPFSRCTADSVHRVWLQVGTRITIYGRCVAQVAPPLPLPHLPHRSAWPTAWARGGRRTSTPPPSPAS